LFFKQLRSLFYVQCLRLISWWHSIEILMDFSLLSRSCLIFHSTPGALIVRLFVVLNKVSYFFCFRAEIDSSMLLSYVLSLQTPNLPQIDAFTDCQSHRRRVTSKYFYYYARPLRGPPFRRRHLLTSSCYSLYGDLNAQCRKCDPNWSNEAEAEIIRKS
jgi:hypothetical protein